MRPPLFAALSAALLSLGAGLAPLQAQTVTLTLPLYGVGLDAIVDWGSANANATCTRRFTEPGLASCTYDDALDGVGPFTVRINGTVPQFGAGDVAYPNANRIRAVTQWGSVGLTSLAGAFNGAEELTAVPADFPPTVTDISHMFKGALKFNQDLTSWGMKMRNVTAMDAAFEDALAFAQPLTRWCAQKVRTPPSNFRAAGVRASSRGALMKLDAAKEPRWGACGVDLAAAPPPAATAGAAFSFDVRAQAALWENAPAEADVNALTFSVVDGALPPGLTLDPATGLISGTPSSAGSWTFRIRAEQPAS